jgi:hypothetical protein
MQTPSEGRDVVGVCSESERLREHARRLLLSDLQSVGDPSSRNDTHSWVPGALQLLKNSGCTHTIVHTRSFNGFNGCNAFLNTTYCSPFVISTSCIPLDMSRAMSSGMQEVLITTSLSTITHISAYLSHANSTELTALVWSIYTLVRAQLRSSIYNPFAS